MRIFSSNEKRKIVIETDGTNISIKKAECSKLELKEICRQILSELETKGKQANLKPDKEEDTRQSDVNYLAVPEDLNLKSGKTITNNETIAVGSWGMFNSFFPGKAVSRILANMLGEKKADFVILNDLVEKTSGVFTANGLSKMRGFPNDPKSESSIGRLVYHFIKTFSQMGFFAVKAKEENGGEVWAEPWTNIEITLTQEGLEFAKLKNKVFDEHEPSQVLTAEEKGWLLDYLRRIDKQGYKEFSILKAVFEFIKEGHNGKDELWKWFIENKSFVEYVRNWSRKANDDKAFEGQVKNLAPTFASSKLALLRELGVIRNKRNDYTIIGDF